MELRIRVPAFFFVWKSSTCYGRFLCKFLAVSATLDGGCLLFTQHGRSLTGESPDTSYEVMLSLLKNIAFFVVHFNLTNNNKLCFNYIVK